MVWPNSEQCASGLKLTHSYYEQKPLSHGDKLATKDDVITQPNDLIQTSAMDQFEEYCLAFVV